MVRRLFGTGGDAVESALRAGRPEPTDELVSDLSALVSASPGYAHRGSRLAFAAALAVLVVGTFLSFGGAAYAANETAQSSATPSSPASAAQDEYGSQPVAKVPPAPPQNPTQNTKPETVTQTPATTTNPTSEVKGETATAPTKSGTLPFTGIGLGTTVLLSVLLVTLGVFLRRRESRE